MCRKRYMSTLQDDLSKHVDEMNPCKSCLKKFVSPPCDALGSCAFEGANIGSLFENAALDEDTLSSH